MPNDREPLLRKLAAGNIPAALELSIEAGWNQTEEDWRLLLDLFPESCLAIEVSGEIVATATLITYGRRLAWIGMVLTRIDYRGRGFAKRLMTEALRLADILGVESVKLDATDQGKPLYEKFGFRSEQAVERWQCENLIVELGDIPSACITPSVHSIDEAAFGANRSTVLEALSRSNPPFAVHDSYAMTRNGRVSEYLGPCMAESADAARRVITSALARHSGKSCCWDLLPANTAAVHLARELGFAPIRHLTRMIRGRELRGIDNRIYALAGFELG